jgi:hypothetical protein
MSSCVAFDRVVLSADPFHGDKSRGLQFVLCMHNPTPGLVANRSPTSAILFAAERDRQPLRLAGAGLF